MTQIKALCFYLLLLATCVLSIPGPLAGSEWDEIGPSAGSSFDLEWAGGTLWASSLGALWRSDDQGRSWNRTPVEIGPAFPSVAVHPDRPDHLLALGLSVLHRSDDRGATWTRVPGIDIGPYSYTVDFAPQDPETVWVALDHRAFRSTDGGMTWSERSEGLATMEMPTGVYVDPHEIDRIFIATTRGTWRSRDAGASWQPLDPSAPNLQNLAFDPFSAGHVLASEQARLYRSTDSGESWGLVAVDTSLPSQIGSVHFDPSRPGRVWVLSWDHLFVSSDGGSQWQEQERPFRAFELPWAPEIRTLFASGYGLGIWSSPDDPVVWQRVDRDFFAGRTTAIAIDSHNPDLLVAGFERAGIHHSSDRGRSWTPAPLLPFPKISDLASSSESGTFYAASRDAGILRSDDGGASWRFASGGLPTFEVYDILVHPSQPETLYAATGEQAAISIDGGRSWATLGGPGSLDADVSELAFAPSDPTVLYAATLGEGLFKSQDAGATWNPLSAPGTSFETLATDPHLPGHVMASGQDAGLIRSLDAGATWTSVDLGNISGFQSLVFDPDRQGVVYGTGSTAGPWRSLDGGLHWTSMAEGLWRPAGRTLALDPVDSHVVYFGADGGSLLRRDLATDVDCPEGSPRALCLAGSRFKAEVRWRAADGSTGTSQAVLGSDDSGLFWFFDEDNWEMLVKVLDACGVNERFWVFAAATTDVEYKLFVTDMETGARREYFNSLGTASPAVTDTDAFEGCPASPPGPIAAAGQRGAEAPTSILLSDDRFRVEVRWENDLGSDGSGRVAPLRADDSGLFWFFDEGNWEMLVKVLDGCAVNGHYWVFAAATTDVGYRIQVTDTETGTREEYVHPPGTAAPALTDTTAFAFCP